MRTNDQQRAPLTSTMASAATLTEGEDAVLFPRGGWDTHHHIFDPKSFPYSPKRHLTPPPATIAAFKELKRSLGITRSVLTHGLSYGDDCTSLKAFVSELGAHETAAVGVIDPDKTSDEELRSMHDAGVRGVRVNLYRYEAMEDAERQKVALLAHLKRITSLSLPWSLTMTTTRPGSWDILEPFVRDVVAEQGIRLVTDHFALLKAPSLLLSADQRADPAKQPGFDAVVRLVRDGHLWVKLSAPYRVSDDGPGYADVRFLVRALVDANKHRVLWGSDWPHTPRMKTRTREAAMAETPFLEVDDEAWLRSLRSWLSDEEWDLMMVRNPSRLFGQ
ncbi:Putative metal-dependent hydrolase [Colletotrichum destructivum]|uniref:Metal-dependent hydrolase n=1 Tax=Colletotrichum destructivum TaxID=34406 RepID=A0AAX4IWG6_9PEZI|nr:Putative metal-dependent hydrolase [Colletotrichum destructivum]